MAPLLPLLLLLAAPTVNKHIWQREKEEMEEKMPRRRLKMPRRCKSLSNRMKKVEDLFSTGNICHCIYPVVETRDVDDMEEEDTKDAKHAKDG